LFTLFAFLSCCHLQAIYICAVRLHWLLPDIKGIPVLMYHRVWPGQRDGLTLTPEDLKGQWDFLKDSGYECLTMERFLRIMTGGEPAPAKAFLLTFDDGYRNNLDYVYPLLQEYGWEATIFIIAGTLDGSMEQEEGLNQKLSLADLHTMVGAHINLGLHGYHHENFSENSIADIKKAMLASFTAFVYEGLLYEKVLAYPYGRWPKDAAQFDELKEWMSEQGVLAAFRIGNKPQQSPAQDIFELKRIDIRGEDTLDDFKIKLRKGKLKPF
jgi:peptidoglycan/xylan/chitin deacetylase (PgdA/CDA1 family)